MLRRCRADFHIRQHAASIETRPTAEHEVLTKVHGKMTHGLLTDLSLKILAESRIS
jgi:hypothetical protein